MKSTVPVELDLPALVKTHQQMVWRYLRLLGCESALAEDLTQEVFLAVFRKPPQTANDAATAGFLRRVARNKFVDHLRRQNRTLDLGLVEIDLDRADQVWRQAQREDGGQLWLQSLRHCLELLEGRSRTVLYLRYRDQAPIRKVADAVGMKESGVKTMLGRIKLRLRQCVERKVAQS